MKSKGIVSRIVQTFYYRLAAVKSAEEPYIIISL